MARAKAVTASVLDAMTIEMWPVSRLTEYASNPRNISEASIAKTAASIKEFGFRVPIIVDAEGVIIAGHTRLRASKQLGLEVVPVHVAEGLTAAQAKAFRIMENRSHDESKWDNERLLHEFEALSFEEMDISLTGFNADEISKLLGEDVAAPIDFASYDESIPTEHKCPKCGYTWSGKQA